MDARDFISVGMSAERTLVVPPERTVRHFLGHMPAVYGTPMMILEMEMASGDAIARALPQGWVTVGTEVRTTAAVVAVERRVIRFQVAAFEGMRRIGDGRHARGLIDVAKFEKRFG